MSLGIEDWGLSTGSDGELHVGGCSASDLAREHGTPLHVVDEERLRSTVREYVRAFRDRYPGAVEPYYALKCNSVPGVVKIILESGALPEVMSEYEYWLARRLGAEPGDVIVNGPYKPASFLTRLVTDGVSGIVVDSLHELEELGSLTPSLGCRARILLRLNLDLVPQGMNPSTAAASRTGSVFGLDVREGEHLAAFEILRRYPLLEYEGLHAHIGTGCKRADDHARAVARVGPVLVAAAARGLETRRLDLGGGYGSATAREFSTMEFLSYLALGRLPGAPDPTRQATFSDFAERISAGVEELCSAHGVPLPALMLEPGRALVSPNVVLLLSVLEVEPGRGGSVVVTDGGRWTTTFQPTYEYHEFFLCRAASAPRSERYTLLGNHAFGGDVIVRNKRLPPLEPGDVLAVMDSGAYFTSMEANFGHPRPPYVSVRAGRTSLLRRREEPEDMLAREVPDLR